MSKKILFLGYGPNETRIFEELKKNGCSIERTVKEIHTINNYDLAISFGYKHIIKKDLIRNSNVPIINLHISYLPWNKGAHPNFWSFIEGSPSGVTIHLIDEGIDTGDILYQKKILFSSNEKTFKSTYIRLMHEIEKLFIDNLDNIINGNYTPKPQNGIGSFHRKNQLPKEFHGWDSDIEDEIIYLKKILNKKEK